CLADAVGSYRSQRPRRGSLPGGDRRPDGEVPRGIAEGHPARTRAPGDDRDLAASWGPAPGFVDPHRQGPRPDAAGRGAAGPRGPPVRRGGTVPDAKRPQGDGRQDRPQGALLTNPTTQGPVR